MFKMLIFEWLLGFKQQEGCSGVGPKTDPCGPTLEDPLAKGSRKGAIFILPTIVGEEDAQHSYSVVRSDPS